MTTRTITIYSFDELSDRAKEKARDWWRDCESQEFGDHGGLTEPAETAGKILGIEFKTHGVPLMNGKTCYEPCIWWSLHSQGSGASFEGNYAYAKNAAKRIRAEFGGKDGDTLAGIANRLQDLQKRHFYGLTASISTSSHGHSIYLDVNDRHGFGVDADVADELRDIMRDFARWIHCGISDEWDYRMSDESVDESIRANEYEFNEDGSRA